MPAQLILLNMKKLWILPLLLIGGMVQAQSLATRQDSISYMLGADLAKNLSGQGVKLNAEFLAQGMKDVFEGVPSKFDQATSQNLMMALQMQMQQGQRQKMAEAASANVAKGQAFLEENGQREGVTTTASGLQYEVITMGTGPKPTATQMVEVNYEGRLLDNTIFDSSYQRGQSISFPLNGVIRGWTEGLQLMPVGSKFRLFIPANLAYGEAGSPPAIGPGETLVFDVELIAIK